MFACTTATVIKVMWAVLPCLHIAFIHSYNGRNVGVSVNINLYSA